MRELAAFSKPSYPSFYGLARITGGRDFKTLEGRAVLALEDNRYRLEVINKAGLVSLAVAGWPGRMTRMDPASGHTEEITGSEAGVLPIARGRVPALVLRSIVTGAPPEFSGVVSAGGPPGARVVRTWGPRMRLVYSGGLEKVVLEDAGGGVVIKLGPMAQGAAAPYVSYARIEAEGGGAVEVRWERVMQGIEFPEGFFRFAEPLEWTPGASR
ncbi:MAG: hypothetical protein ACNS63_02685 [Candidatus Nitrospinota bacterium M3_3B_026]